MQKKIECLWTVPREWEGETAFIIAGGPSVTQEHVDRLKGRKVCVVNTSWEKAPWADFLFFGDGRWYLDNKRVLTEFSGRIVTVANFSTLKKILFLRKTDPPGLCKTPDGVMVRRTSVTGAINLAAHLGAKKIYLLGADGKKSADGRTHHHKPHQWPQRDSCWNDQANDFKTLPPSLAVMGVEVFNCNPDSALKVFPFADLNSVVP